MGRGREGAGCPEPCGTCREGRSVIIVANFSHAMGCGGLEVSKLRVVGLFLLLAAGWTGSWASEAVPGPDEVVVGISDSPPWKMVVEGQSAQGIEVELIQLLFQRLGLRPRFVGMPWARCLKSVEDGEVDLISGVLRLPEREGTMHFLEPAYKTSSNKVFYVRRGQGPVLRRCEDLAGLTVGVVRGQRYFQPFDSDDGILRDEATTAECSLKKLAKGRVSAVVCTESTCDWLIANNGMAGLFEKSPLRHEDPTPVYFVLSRKSRHAARLADFNRAVEDLDKGGVFRQVIGTRLASFRID